MFQPSQHDVRRFFCEVLRKQRAREPLTPMEAVAAPWVAEHPEYHADLADVDYADVVASLRSEVEEAAKVYFAAVTTTPSCLTSDYADVMVMLGVEAGFTVNPETGEETPEYSLGEPVGQPMTLPVRHDDDQADAGEAADKALRAAGWVRVGAWEGTDTGATARVERI